MRGVPGGAAVRGAGPRRRQQFFDGHDGLVRSLAQHPNNRNLFASASAALTAASAPVLLVWDAANVGAKGLSMPLTVADASVRSVSFSADGQHLASVSSDAHYTLKLFHWPTTALLASVHTTSTSAASPASPRSSASGTLYTPATCSPWASGTWRSGSGATANCAGSARRPVARRSRARRWWSTRRPRTAPKASRA